jgi:hypothetical protein
VISNSKLRLANESSEASTEYSDALNKQKYTVYDGKTTEQVDASLTNLVSYTKSIDTESTQTKYRYVTNAAGKLCISQADYNIVKNYVNGGVVTGALDYFQKMGVPRDTTGNAPFYTPDETSSAYKYYAYIWQQVSSGNYNQISDDKANNADYLSEQVQNGNMFLHEYDSTEQTKDSNGNVLSTGAFEEVSWDSGDNNIQEKDDSTQTARAEAKYDATMADINAKDKRFDLELKNIDTEHQAIQTEVDSVKKVIDKNIERSFKMFQA